MYQFNDMYFTCKSCRAVFIRSEYDHVGDFVETTISNDNDHCISASEQWDHYMARKYVEWAFS